MWRSIPFIAHHWLVSSLETSKQTRISGHCLNEIVNVKCSRSFSMVLTQVLRSKVYVHMTMGAIRTWNSGSFRVNEVACFSALCHKLFFCVYLMTALRLYLIFKYWFIMCMPYQRIDLFHTPPSKCICPRTAQHISSLCLPCSQRNQNLSRRVHACWE